jgi:hypothetical protein
MSTVSDDLIKFRDGYLLNRTEVGTYRKSKKYARNGKYISLILSYFVLVSISEFWPSEPIYPISILGITVISVAMTINQRSKYKSFEFDSEDRSAHDVAAFIDAYERDDYDGLMQEYNQREYHITENVLLCESRQDSLWEYLIEAESRDEEFVSNTFNTNFEIIVNDIRSVFDDKLESPKAENSNHNSIADSPSRLEVLFSLPESDSISRTTRFWAVFIFIAAAGVGVAIWQKIGWGILTVTILFAGVRYYDTLN